MLLQTVANQLPSGSNLDPLCFFFWLGSNTVAKTPLKKKKKREWEDASRIRKTMRIEIKY